MTDHEPIHDIAHLAHVELLTPKPEESLRFFVDVMGMTESGRKGDSVYLRGWDDYEHHSLQLTASKTSGLGHYALRAARVCQYKWLWRNGMLSLVERFLGVKALYVTRRIRIRQ